MPVDKRIMCRDNDGVCPDCAGVGISRAVFNAADKVFSKILRSFAARDEFERVELSHIRKFHRSADTEGQRGCGVILRGKAQLPKRSVSRLSFAISVLVYM